VHEESDLLPGPIAINTGGTDFSVPITAESCRRNQPPARVTRFHREDGLSACNPRRFNADTVLFTAEVTTGDGKVIAFHAHKVPGMPAEPGRTQDLQLHRLISITEKIVRVRLRSNHRVVVPRVAWQSWNQGM
jgi:hypothetical protein